MTGEDKRGLTPYSSVITFLETSPSNDPLIRNLTEVGRIISTGKGTQENGPLERWHNANTPGGFFKTSVQLALDQETMPNIIIQGFGRPSHLRWGSRPSGYYFGCLRYFADGNIVVNFDRQALPEGVAFDPVQNPEAVKKYLIAVVENNGWITSIGKIESFQPNALEYLRSFSKEALNALKAPESTH